MNCAAASAAEPAELTALRQHAFQYFKKAGFPSNKVEDWKYTNLAPFLKESFSTSTEELVEVSDEVIRNASIPHLDVWKVVLVNGAFRKDLSDTVNQEGVFVLPIAEAASRPAFIKHFGAYTDVAKKSFRSGEHRTVPAWIVC